MHRSIAVVLLAAGASLADLKVGDAAPALAIDTWVKGDGVSGFKDNHVYVVEFWATWCGPCIAGIPHLTELQEKYEDHLTVISISTLDQRGNNLGSVQQLVKAQGDRMDYTVAFNNSRTTYQAWMSAAGRNTIPSAFLVGPDGRIEFIGHPNGLDKPIADAVARIEDTPDAAAVDPTETKEAIVLKQRIGAALEEEDFGEAISQMSRLIRIDKIRYAGWAAQRIDLLIVHNERAAQTQVREAVRRTYKDDHPEQAWILATVLRSDKANERLIEQATESGDALAESERKDPRLDMLAAELKARAGDREQAVMLLARAREMARESKLDKQIKAQLEKELTARLMKLGSAGGG